MTNVRLSETRAQGFRAYTVANGLVSFTIVPDLGGKISSIRDLRTGREWLWTNPRLPYRKLPYGASYVEEADTGGWDECFPTVAECVYPLPPRQGLRIPDHGELWPQAWRTEVYEKASGGLSIHTEVGGVELPYVFRRSVGLEPRSATLCLDYEAENFGESDIAFIWSAHPLFAVEPGMRVSLPDSTRMVVYLSVPGELFPDNSEHGWPVRARVRDEEVDFSLVPEPSVGVAAKLWAQPLAEGCATIAAPDGEFRFAFDPDLVPQIGLWVNAGAWSGAGAEPYYNVALEPCMGAQDSLQEAFETYGQYEILPARGTRAWWLEASLDAR